MRKSKNCGKYIQERTHSLVLLQFTFVRLARRKTWGLLSAMEVDVYWQKPDCISITSNIRIEPRLKESLVCRFQLCLDVSKVPVVLAYEMWPAHLPVRLIELCLSKEFLVPVEIGYLLELLEAVYVLWVTFLNSVCNWDKINAYMMIICLSFSSVVFY